MQNFYCTHCGQSIEVTDGYANKLVRCPTCKGELRVPQSTNLMPKSVSPHHQMSLADFYFSFDGRISVEDYWVKGIFVGFALGVLAVVIDTAIDAKGVFLALFLLASFWPSAALLVKRWHDRDKSGWFYWVLFIPVIGPFWTLVEAGCMTGTKGENRFGPDPVRRRRSATHTAAAPEKKINPIPWIIAACIVLGLFAIAKIITASKLESQTDMSVKDTAIQQELEETAKVAAKAKEVEATAAKDQQQLEALEAAKGEAKAQEEEVARQTLENVRLKEERKRRAAGSKPGDEKTIELAAGVSMKFCWIPPGEFIMGSPEGEIGRSYGQQEQQHNATIIEGFWMSKYEVTQSVWEVVMGNNPSMFKEYKSKLPVEQVSLNDITRSNGFLNKLNIYQDDWMKFRLPTETEWEYACRAETLTALNNNKNLTSLDALCPNLNEVAWYQYNAYRPKEVGGKKSNSWGLCDMHGNVSEWCDNTSGSYRGTEDNYWPIRGGCFRYGPGGCRSASNNARSANERKPEIGFRLVYLYINISE